MIRWPAGIPNPMTSFIEKPLMKSRSLYRPLLTFFTVIILSLGMSGCMNAAEVNHQVNKDQSIADRALKTIEPKPYRHNPLTVDERPWYGSKAVPIDNGKPLPPMLLQTDGIVMTFERPMTFSEVARMIQAASGIRVMVGQSANAASPALEQQVFVPADGVEVTGGRVVWQGALPDLLNQVTDYFDAEWIYDGAAIKLTQEVTKTFMLHALADVIDFNGTIENASDESGVLPQVEIDSEATLEIWKEIQDTVDTMVGTKGRATYSPTTGAITVSGPPSVVQRAEHFLREQNRARLRRVAVAVKVLNVETTNENTLGFNLTGVLERAIDGKPFQFSAVGDGLTAGILRAVPFIDPVTGQPTEGAATQPDNDTVTSVLTASEDINRVSLSNSGAVVTLSDIPAPLQVGRTVAYIKRVSSSSTGDGGGNVSLEPGEVNLGLTMNVLPRVIQRDRVLLRLAIGITDAQTPFDTRGAGDLVLELPEVETTGFLQNAVLAQGETLVLAGFEKNTNSLRDQGVPGGLFTGGTRTMQKNREVSVLLITAEVLPEEPLTVIGGDM